MVKKSKQKERINNILIIRFSSIGDIVLTSSVIRCLRRTYPEATIHYLVKDSFKSILEANPYIDKIHIWNKKLSPNEILPNEQIDYVVDLQKNHRSRKIVHYLNTRHATINKLNIRKWLYVNFKWNTLPDKNIADRYFEGVKELGVKNDGLSLDYFIPEKDITKQEDIPMGHWAGYVAAVIGGAHGTKKMPIHKWQSLVAICPYPIIIIGGPEDKEAAHVITLTDPNRIYNACEKFNINESADLIKRSKVVVSHDTGMMHIATAFKKPLVSIWGNTTPELGFYPYYGSNNLKDKIYPDAVIIERSEVSCRPCSKLGYDSCPKKHFKCMESQDVAEINEAINRLWNK